MSILLIVGMIVLGILLLMVEFLIIPGITVAGIGGMILIGGSIYMAYKYHGPFMGNIILISTLLLIIVSMYFALRSKTWKKVMLKTEIDSKTSESLDDKLKAGDRGKAITRLAPMGNAMFGDLITEVKTMGEFVDPNSEVEIVKVHNKEVIVKPLTHS